MGCTFLKHFQICNVANQTYMTVIHCAGYRVTLAMRAGGDLFAIAVKFNDYVYGVITSPDSQVNTELIRGQPGQVILKWPQGFDADPIEFKIWNVPAGWVFKISTIKTSALIANPFGSGNSRKFNGFNLTPTQEAALAPYLINSQIYSGTTTLGNSKLVESGFLPSAAFSPVSAIVRVVNTAGTGFVIGKGYYFYTDLSPSLSKWRNETSTPGTISTNAVIGDVGFIITTGVDFTWNR